MQRAVSEKIGPVSPLAFVALQLTVVNPLSAPLCVAGLVYPFAGRGARPYRLLAWIFLTVFVLLLASGAARIHYLAPAFTIPMAAGGCAVERLLATRVLRRAVLLWAVAIAVFGALAAPVALPLLSPERLLAYYGPVMTGMYQERAKSGALPISLALRFHSEATMRAVTRAYGMLSPEERAGLGILTWSFGSAGAVNHFGPALGLPRAIGVHNHYWLWGPGEYTGETLLVLAPDADALKRWFGDVERMTDIDCEYCMPFLRQSAVYLCREPRRPLADLWPEMKFYN
jgi:hypothetical protein